MGGDGAGRDGASRLWRRVALPLALAGLVGGATAGAQPAPERFGAMQLTLDAEAWRVERPSPQVLRLVPVGPMVRTARPMTLTQVASADLTSCADLAQAQLTPTLYERPERQEIQVDGHTGVAMRARTRCRNATPTGFVLCLPYRGVGYVLADRLSDCRTGQSNLFSKDAWRDALIAGIRFMP